MKDTSADRPILALDFDGVLHSYSSGWKGADVIPDPPVPGAIPFLSEAVQHFTVTIYSSRSGQAGGIHAMKVWLHKHTDIFFGDDPQAWKDSAPGARLVDVIQWPTEKPPATISIDDRCLTFTGQWPTMDELKAFKPWNRK